METNSAFAAYPTLDTQIMHISHSLVGHQVSHTIVLLFFTQIDDARGARSSDEMEREGGWDQYGDGVTGSSGYRRGCGGRLGRDAPPTVLGTQHGRGGDDEAPPNE